MVNDTKRNYVVSFRNMDQAKVSTDFSRIEVPYADMDSVITDPNHGAIQFGHEAGHAIEKQHHGQANSEADDEAKKVENAIRGEIKKSQSTSTGGKKPDPQPGTSTGTDGTDTGGGKESGDKNDKGDKGNKGDGKTPGDAGSD